MQPVQSTFGENNLVSVWRRNNCAITWKSVQIFCFILWIMNAPLKVYENWNLLLFSYSFLGTLRENIIERLSIIYWVFVYQRFTAMRETRLRSIAVINKSEQIFLSRTPLRITLWKALFFFFLHEQYIFNSHIYIDI